MAVGLKEKNISTLTLVVLVGILIGSFLGELVGSIPNSVVKTFFTYHFINFGVGYPEPLLVDMSAVKFQIGFMVKFNLLSIIGIFISLYFFRWYK